MTPTETSLKTYYDLVMSGESDKQRHRIMRHILTAGRPITRHEIVDLHFYTQPGPKALDGLRPIPLQSACGRIRELLDISDLEVGNAIGIMTMTKSSLKVTIEKLPYKSFGHGNPPIK